MGALMQVPEAQTVLLLRVRAGDWGKGVWSSCCCS